MDQVNLLQSYLQFASIIIDVNIKPSIKTFILDDSDALYVKIYLGFVILELKVSCLWLKVQNVVCY